MKRTPAKRPASTMVVPIPQPRALNQDAGGVGLGVAGEGTPLPPKILLTRYRELVIVAPVLVRRVPRSSQALRRYRFSLLEQTVGSSLPFSGLRRARGV